MNYYELSKRIDVFDSKESKLYMSMTGIGTPAYHRYLAARWLAWYRVFYRNNDNFYCRQQIRYFLEELKTIKIKESVLLYPF